MQQYESNERRGASGVIEERSVQQYESNEWRGSSGVKKERSVQQYESNERRGACGVCQCINRGCMWGNKKVNNISLTSKRACGV